MKLFVNGCSFTHGHKDFDDDMRSPEWVWPNQMSDIFDESHNLAWQGGSNHRIVRTTLEFFDKIKDCSNWVAIIQWTNIYYRTELHDNESDTYFGCCPGSLRPVLSGSDKTKFISIPNRIFRMVDSYQRTAQFRSDKQQLDTFIYQCFILNEFFQRKGIKFLFTGMNSTSMIPNDVEHPLIPYLLTDAKLLPFSNFVNKNTPRLIESDTDYHPNKAGHTVIANYITKELRARNYL